MTNIISTATTGETQRRQAPGVTSVRLDRKNAVRVELSGRYGAGCSMLLDADAWDEMSAMYGTQWHLHANGGGRLYVRSCRNAVKAAANQPSASGTASLARLITGAVQGEVVLFRNGDPLDLRRANLVKLAQADATVWHGKPVKQLAA